MTDRRPNAHAWVITLAIIAALAMGALAAVELRYRALRSSVLAACGDASVVNRLDLTDWIEPCRLAR